MAKKPAADAICFRCGERSGDHRADDWLCPFRAADGSMHSFCPGRRFSLTATEQDRRAAARGAAMELLEALRAVARADDWCSANCDSPESAMSHYRDVAAQARAALALAEPKPATKLGGSK